MKKICSLILAISMFTAFIYSADTDVRLNSLGFLPNNVKKASISLTCTTFNLIRVSDAAIVYTGTVGAPITSTDTGETILVADFSAYTTPGTYYLNVPGVGNSQNFNIAADIYNTPFVPVFKGMYEWRCGTAVSYTYGGDTFSHAACHTTDALDDQIGGTGTRTDSTKGWHDAGDYNKYIVTGGMTIGMMLNAWEMFGAKINSLSYGLPATAPGYPEFLEEIKWETDWILTMQLADGGALDKVSEVTFSAFILPELDTDQRYYWGISGTVETASLCASLAMAARNFQPYDAAYVATCLSAATAAYNYLTSHTTNTTANITGSPQGSYVSSNANAGRMWAAAEMWETTGTAAYLTDFETRANAMNPKIDTNWDWGNYKNLGMFTYLLSLREGRSAALVNTITTALNTSANSIVTTGNGHAYGRGLGTNYYWGSNGGVARQTMILQIANKLSPNANYINASLDILGYLFGRNMHDRSYVTGVGYNPPMNPHHRPSGGDSIVNPWPGYLVGGSPGGNTQDTYESANLPTGLPAAQYWVDVQAAYSANEVAVNWQGALIFAMAGFISSLPTPTLTATPSVTQTGTFTPTATRTVSPTFTRTTTPTFTMTNTPVNSNTASPTAIYTKTPAFTNTNTGTYTATANDTPSRKATVTNTPTFTRTNTGTATFTFTTTPDYSPTATQTITATATGSPPSQTFTPTVTRTSSVTLTRTNTPVDTATPTWTNTRVNTGTMTFTNTFTTVIFSPTFTTTVTQTSTVQTSTYTQTPTYTPTVTPTVTSTVTSTATLTSTLTATQTQTLQNTATITATNTVPVPTDTPTPVEVKVWPCPVDPDTQDMYVGFDLTGQPASVRFKVYTKAFRLIKNIVITGTVPGVMNEGKVNREYLSGMANGIYLYVIESMVNGGIKRSKIKEFII